MDKFRVLIFGTIFSQSLLLVFLPYFTSIYSPESFSELALFNAICASMYPIISGRLNFALMALDDKKRVKNLLEASFLYIYVSASIFLFFLSFFFNLSEYESQSILFFQKLFLFLVFFCHNEMLLSYFNRLENYWMMTSLKVFRTIFLLILYYIFQFRQDGIVIGNIFSLGIVVVISTIYFKINFWKKIKNLTLKYLSEFKDFLIFNSVANSLNGLIVSLPVFFINLNYGSETLGSHSLFLLIVAGPLTMLGKSISQYSMGRISSMKSNDLPGLSKFFHKLLLILFLICIVFYLSLTIFNLYLFKFFFDVKWSLTSSIISALSIGFIFQFFAMSISNSLEVLGYVNRSSKFRIIMFLSNVSIHFYAYYSSLSFIDYIKILAIEKIIIYSSITILTYKSLRDFISK
tara:strand:+ start:304 stop:1518 length:1215 start_codon:yes stop_codon:yes gene_type:complete